MNPVPFAAVPRSVASGPPRSGARDQFEVVFQAPPGDAPIVLRSTADANEATMAFHEVLQRLRRQMATGELIVRNADCALVPLLRQPL
jgi:hypothetical protein